MSHPMKSITNKLQQRSNSSYRSSEKKKVNFLVLRWSGFSISWKKVNTEQALSQAWKCKTWKVKLKIIMKKINKLLSKVKEHIQRAREKAKLRGFKHIIDWFTLLGMKGKNNNNNNKRIDFRIRIHGLSRKISD